AQSQIPSPSKTKQSRSVIHSNSRLVVLDVVVTDKAGHPITGLTKDDFEVLEDGKPQVIANFEPADAHFDNAAMSPASVDVKEAPATLAAADRPETILVLDELNTSFVDASFGWQMLIKYLRKQPATL